MLVDVDSEAPGRMWFRVSEVDFSNSLEFCSLVVAQHFLGKLCAIACIHQRKAEIDKRTVDPHRGRSIWLDVQIGSAMFDDELQ